MSVAQYLEVRGLTDSASEPSKPSKEGPPIKHVELVDLTEKDRGHGDQPLVLHTHSYHKAKDTLGKYDDYALIVRRKRNKDDEETSTTLEVRSPIIRETLKDILRRYSYLNLEGCPIEIKKPYGPLFHYRQELRDYTMSPERSSEQQKHLNLLIKFMDDKLSATERRYLQLVPNGMVDFDDLWTIYRAEDIIVQQTDHFRQCYRITSCGMVTDSEGIEYFELRVWSWGYNGYKFGPVEEQLRIDSFPVPRRIDLLQFCPLELLSDDEQERLTKSLISRGRLWRDAVNLGHHYYNGPTWVDPPLESAKSMAKLVITYMRGRIMLDHRSHEQENFYLATSLYGSSSSQLSEGAMFARNYRRYYTLNDSSVDRSLRSGKSKGSLNDMKCYENTAEYQISDEQALLTPARVRGFSLTNKRWAFFLLDYISEIKWNHDAFSALELEPIAKRNVRCLVESHSAHDPVFDDIIVDKGKGLVMLLYGAPGTGKTLTAESIADYARRPLYHIGARELGTEVTSTERALQKIFNLAREWDAILLLDEADCFLSKRTSDDMERNAFVTIFLRLLEYHSGILFLTTNRSEEFDPAFSSRIHLKVKYDDLDANRRARIWRNLLETRVQGCEMWHQRENGENEDVYERLGREVQANGREIKNLIRTTLAITRNSGGLTEEALMGVYRLNMESSTAIAK
ncbi:hypothetical protein ACLMJK_003207 [Lecanora helva]